MYKKPAEEVNHYTVNLIVQCLSVLIHLSVLHLSGQFRAFSSSCNFVHFCKFDSSLVIYVKIRLILTLYAHNNFLFRCFNKLRSIHKMGKNCVELDIWSTLYTKPMIVNLFKIFFDVAKHYTILILKTKIPTNS